MRAIIAKAITRQERALGAPLDWLREVANTSISAFFKFTLVTPLGFHRKRLSREAWHLARVAVTRQEDCGACVQIVVDMALRDGIPPELLRAALRPDGHGLPAGLADVHRFARIVASGADDLELRQKLRDELGNEAFLELALTIATARIIPTIKRALGYSRSCSLVRIHINGAPASAEESAAPATAATSANA